MPQGMLDLCRSLQYRGFKNKLLLTVAIIEDFTHVKVSMAPLSEGFGPPKCTKPYHPVSRENLAMTSGSTVHSSSIALSNLCQN